MEVKIYREVENESLILDSEQLQEYNSLACELGFATQDNLEQNDCPVIYPILNQAMQKQLNAICPSSVEADKYTRTTIPLEVLKVYKFAKENNMFDGFKILYDDKAPDPILIGWKWQDQEAKVKGYNWRADKYIIARWGDCAKEIEQLLEEGFQRIVNQLREKAIEAQEKCNSILNHPEVYARKIVNGNSSDMRIDLNTDADRSF